MHKLRQAPLIVLNLSPPNLLTWPRLFKPPLDSAIHRMNYYLADKYRGNQLQRYPPFEQIAPDYIGAILLLCIWYTYSKKEEIVKMMKMVNTVWNPINTDIRGTCHSVCIKYFTDTCFYRYKDVVGVFLTATERSSS